MTSSERLYTPELLGLAVELAQWPPLETAPLHGSARSKTCGSTLELDLSTDGQGRIQTLGMRVRACAVGQAAASIFARHASGADQARIRATHDRMEAWLEGEAPPPDWPDLAMIAAATSYPARHGAMLLPWKAALDTLSSQDPAG